MAKWKMLRCRLAIWLLFKHDALFWRCPWLWTKTVNAFLLRMI